MTKLGQGLLKGLKECIILDSTNAAYHADRTHLSSSGLKTLLRSAPQFYQEYVLGQKEQVDKPAFQDGTLLHALILEPHKIVTDYAVFPGLRKVGKAFEEFKQANNGKVVVSAAQMLRMQSLYRSYTSLPVAVSILEGTLSEHSMVSTILGIPVKARADAISISRKCIIDVKSTSMPSGAEVFAQTILDYSYHLSAALYCQIAFNTYGELFDFYWLVLSKDDGQCHVYKASTETLSTGSALVTQALVKYKKCKESNIWLDETIKTDYSTMEYEIEEL